jgi:hypothetical protein
MLTESFPLQDPGDELTVDFPEPETSRPEAAQAGSPKAAEGPQQLNEGLSIQDQSAHFWSRWKTTIRNFGGNLRATWRRASGWLRAKADQSPFTSRAFDAIQESSPRERTVGAGVLLLLVILVLLGFRYFRGGTPDDPQRQVVTQWLDSQLAGGTGSNLMEPRPGSARMHFYGLRSWRFISKPRSGEFVIEVTCERPNGEMTTGKCRVTTAKTERGRDGSFLKVVDVDLSPDSTPSP